VIENDAFGKVWKGDVVANFKKAFQSFPGGTEEIRVCHSVLAVFHVDGMKLYLWTSATNGPIVHPPADM
jgi:hypothetical protein